MTTQADETGHILAQLAAEDSRLQIVEGDPLPPGWLGKNWACHQLAQRADGELFLFVDADTSHHPHTLQDAVAAIVAEKADLISAIPHQQVVTWAERLVVPVIPWSILSFLPLGLAHRLGTPVLSAAIGQFMLFRRTAYAQVGGHSAVRQSVVDDLSLARRIKAAGLRWRLLDGTPRVRCRMYRDAGEVFQGISRTLFAVFGNKISIHLFVWLWLAVVFLEPLVVLVLGLAGFAVPALSLRLAGLAVGASLLLWAIAYHRFGIPHYLSLLYPVSILLAVVIAMYSTISTLTGLRNMEGSTTCHNVSDAGVEEHMSNPDTQHKNDTTSTTTHGRADETIYAIPTPTPEAGRRALRAILQERSVLAALSIFHEELGDVFRISLGSFSPIFMVGPEASRFVLITARDHLLWRPPDDPVTSLLRNGSAGYRWRNT